MILFPSRIESVKKLGDVSPQENNVMMNVISQHASFGGVGRVKSVNGRVKSRAHVMYGAGLLLSVVHEGHVSLAILDNIKGKLAFEVIKLSLVCIQARIKFSAHSANLQRHLAGQLVKRRNSRGHRKVGPYGIE
jgi:hypothetical protein